MNDAFQKSSQLNDEGIELANADQPAAAADKFHQAVLVDPKFAEAYFNLGTANFELNELGLSLLAFEQAFKLDPSLPEVHFHMGVINRELKKFKKAVEQFELELKMNPNHMGALKKLALLHHDQHQIYKSCSYFKKVIELGDAYYLFSYVWLMQWLCDWAEVKKYSLQLDKVVKADLATGKKSSDNPLSRISRSDDNKINYLVAKSWADELERKVRNAPKFSYHKKPPSSKISIGYLSADYKNHAVAHQTVDLFKLHNRDKFKIYAYSLTASDNTPFRKHIENTVDEFIDLDKSKNTYAAHKINSDKIDILVDLNGHTKDNRMVIAALRPAPVQATWIGFPGTSGAKFFDYAILDKIVVPPNIAKKFYSEHPLYMPDTFQITSHAGKLANQPSPPKVLKSDFKLPTDGFVFGSFCQTYKITPKIFDSWMRILIATPGSVLWTFVKEKESIKNLKREAKAGGINPDRLIFAANVPKQTHLARLKFCDLALDTIAVNGGATATDLLWAGVPLVTKTGQHFASRVASSILSAAGMTELITNNLAEYEQLAIELAHHPAKLKKIRQKLAKNIKTQPLFNTQLFVKNLEAGYHKIWQLHQQQLAPRQVNI
jgi:protein O-GlcNAc transferase